MIEKNSKAIHHVLSGEYFRSLTKDQYLYLATLIGFIVIATIISSSFSKDSHTYNSLFDVFGASGWSALTSNLLQRETFFVVLSKLLYQFGVSSIFLFLIHAVISLPIKFYLIDKHSKNRFLSLAYFSSYFFYTS